MRRPTWRAPACGEISPYRSANRVEGPTDGRQKDRQQKAAPFEYRRAASLDEALALLATYGGEAKLIAGGQSLVTMMAQRLAWPAVLVDINHIDTLRRVAMTPRHVALGAMTRQCALAADAGIVTAVPLPGAALR